MIYERLIRAGIRAERDFRNEKLGMKIREAEIQKIPYMVVLGEREVSQNMVAPRARTGRTLKSMKVEEFIQRIKEECFIGGESYS
jgi:threonyl-tRNA synthetase